MPDLRPVTTAMARLARLEARAVKAGLSIWKHMNALLLLALINSPSGQELAIQAAIAQLARDIRQALATESAAIAPIVEAQFVAQTGVTIPVVAFSGSALALRGWEAAATGLLLSELTRLHSSGADQGAIAARLITGRDGRMSIAQSLGGMLQLQIERNVWATANGHLVQLATAIPNGVFQKQAISAIDARTTQCCRNVHGQIQDLDRPFVLTGTPRFADRIQNPPFHHRCRTAVSLYTPAMEAIGIPTVTMRAQARALAAQPAASRTR
jgi:hypothetical protein